MKRILQFVAAGTLLGIVLSAVFIWGVEWFPTEASQQSKNEFPLFIAITYVSFVIFAVVMVAMGYSLWKFRQRGPSDLRDGDPTHGNTLLEIIWTAIPLTIVAIFGIWGAIVLDDNEAHATGSRVITVIGYSFNFEYRYDSDGRFTRNDGLYVPVGEAITLHMSTPLYEPGSGNKKLEVIHSFWVPEWGVKQDATPGVTGKLVGTTWVTPTRIGTYEVQCTELCGSGHGTMKFKNIHVLSKADFAKWLAGAKKEAAAAKAAAQANPGEAVFNSAGCGGCHTFTPAKSSGTTGPKLDDLKASFQEAKAAGKTKATDLAGFIKESIVKPNAFVAKGYSPGIMPQSFGSTLSPKQIDDLVAYLAKGGSG
jgi:cytochrome c oxidase subunit 2